MQSFSSRIWIRVAVSISYDDNDYTTGSSSSDSFWFSLFLAYFCVNSGVSLLQQFSDRKILLQ